MDLTHKEKMGMGDISLYIPAAPSIWIMPVFIQFLHLLRISRKIVLRNPHWDSFLIGIRQ